jgi:hypothetical protein
VRFASPPANLCLSFPTLVSSLFMRLVAVQLTSRGRRHILTKSIVKLR